MTLTASPLEAAQGADAVLITTEWNEFRELDWAAMRAAMRGNVLVDGRNMHDPARMAQLGFAYYAMGRSPRASAHETMAPVAGGT